MLFLDLDDFKLVNDKLGHAAGDKLLVDVAERLRACLRKGDTVARLGGDEFAVLLQDDFEGPDELGRRVIDAMDVPFQFGHSYAQVTASVGVARLPGGRRCERGLRQVAAVRRRGDVRREADPEGVLRRVGADVAHGRPASSSASHAAPGAPPGAPSPNRPAPIRSERSGALVPACPQGLTIPAIRRSGSPVRRCTVHSSIAMAPMDR